MEKLLEVNNLRTFFYTRRGMVKSVNDVSFDVKKGEILGIAGESGAGKTVIALSILQLVPHPGRILTGEIIYKNENLLDISPREMNKYRGSGIGMIFQDPMSSLNPVYRVGEQIVAGILAHDKMPKPDAYQKAIQMLKAVNIPAPEERIISYQHEFSGGMKQRVMIALALSCNPNLLIADNPTTALDSTIQVQFLNLILELRKRLGMTILYITHDLGITAKLCDRIAVIYAGEIIEIGTTVDVLKNAGHPYTKGLINSYPSLEMRKMKIEPVEGKPPDLISAGSGCKFAPRCRIAKPECKKTRINLYEIGTPEHSHKVRCVIFKNSNNHRSRTSMDPAFQVSPRDKQSNVK
jgi:oligopeptide/dipeptide ABC transporter ATP-binding protein